jgi:hypothetical protein
MGRGREYEGVGVTSLRIQRPSRRIGIVVHQDPQHMGGRIEPNPIALSQKVVDVRHIAVAGVVDNGARFVITTVFGGLVGKGDEHVSTSAGDGIRVRVANT